MIFLGVLRKRYLKQCDYQKMQHTSIFKVPSIFSNAMVASAMTNCNLVAAIGRLSIALGLTSRRLP